MSPHRLGVGIIGLQPGRSWAARAHVPALRALADRFDIVGVANSSRSSAEAAATALGLPRAFDDVAQLLAAPEVDIVTVAVKVPPHFQLVRAAVEHGKHVYCEWPLGNGLAQAEEMARLARQHGVMGVVGMQAPFSPEMRHLKKLLDDGLVGQVLSTTLTGWGGALQGSGSIPDARTYGYLLDRNNGATLLTIPVGHTLAAITQVLGEVHEVSAMLATRRPVAQVLDTGESLPVTAPDQVLVQALLSGDVPLSLHYRGGQPRDGNGLVWDIHGTAGDLRITGASGHAQMVQLAIKAIGQGQSTYTALEVPASERVGWPAEVEPGNVARVYAAMAQDLRTGSRTAPRFEDAVRFHRIVDAIERSAGSGRRVSL